MSALWRHSIAAWAATVTVLAPVLLFKLPGVLTVLPSLAVVVYLLDRTRPARCAPRYLDAPESQVQPERISMALMAGSPTGTPVALVLSWLLAVGLLFWQMVLMSPAAAPAVYSVGLVVVGLLCWTLWHERRQHARGQVAVDVQRRTLRLGASREAIPLSDVVAVRVERQAVVVETLDGPRTLPLPGARFAFLHQLAADLREQLTPLGALSPTARSDRAAMKAALSGVRQPTGGG